MTRFQITGVRKDNLDRITQVQIEGSSFSVETVAEVIDSNRDYIYTMKYGKEATVYPKTHPNTNRIFLTTEPDGSLENNLDFLPRF